MVYHILPADVEDPRFSHFFFLENTREKKTVFYLHSIFFFSFLLAVISCQRVWYCRKRDTEKNELRRVRKRGRNMSFVVKRVNYAKRRSNCLCNCCGGERTHMHVALNNVKQ